jgi:exfoliative toxin A/B
MTFPLVISAVAFYRLGIYHDISSNSIFNILYLATVAIAIMIVVYVFIRYLMFLVRIAGSKA